MKHDSENSNEPADQQAPAEVTDEKPGQDQIAQEIEDEEPDNESTEDPFGDLTREQLVGQLLEANTRISEIEDGFIRAKADVENIRRRSHNEIVSARKYALEGFARELISVVDSLDQASKVEIDSADDERIGRMQEGLELTLKQLGTVMDKFGISPVEADSGESFDPAFHQAISMVDSEDVESGHIVNVVQKGFVLKDRLLRPAMVVIAN